MEGLSGYGLLVLTSLLTTAGQLCQKQAADVWQKGARQPGRLRLALVWLGGALLFLGLGMLAWLLVLRALPVSRAYPMLSLNFVLVALAARFLFGETTTRRHWAGILSIVIGVILLGMNL